MALENNTQINYTDRNTIDNWFKTGLKPTQQQFWATWASFWHKSDSLPISSINRLGDLLDGKAETNHTHDIYATNDASSLTAENVTAWQNALGVDDLNYVEIPTTDATAESHPYVVVIDDEGKSAKRNAGDFGKVDTIDGIEADETKDVKLGAVRKTESNEVLPSFDLHQKDGAYVSIDSDGLKVSKGGIYSLYKPESIKPFNQVPGAAYQFQELLFPIRTATGTEEKVYPITYINGVKANENGKADIWGVANNWTNSSQRFSGLTDKSSDATFNLFPVFDNSRNLNFVSNPYQLLKKGFGILTSEQALELGTILGGGGGSAGAMSVNIISPPIIQNRFDSVEYIYLRGANLRLDTGSRKIEIINSINNQVVLIIPNNQIISTSDVELIFYYNFNLFPLGDYKIRLTSGAKIYTTDWQLKIVQSVTDVDFNNLTWDIKTKDGYSQNSATSATGSSLLAVASSGSETTFPVLSLKSSELFAQGEDFYLELQCNITLGAGFYGVQKSVFGIGYSSGQNEAIYLMNVGLNYSHYSGNINVGTNYTSNNVSYIAQTPYSSTITIIKTGNLFRVISRGAQETMTLSNNSGYSIFAQLPASPVLNSLSVRIVKAFKIN